MLLHGRAPEAGEVMRMPNLANTFRELAKHGKKGFYEGRIAEEIVQVLSGLGSLLTLDDLKNHRSTMDKPISVNYKVHSPPAALARSCHGVATLIRIAAARQGVNVYEIPPNGQGITALMALNMLKQLEEHTIPDKLEHNSAEYLHTLIECVRIAFADTRYYVADPSRVHVPIEELLSDRYAKARLEQYFKPDKAAVDVEKGSPASSSCTVYFSVVDEQGNACSFINSNYVGFGSGIIPKGSSTVLACSPTHRCIMNDQRARSAWSDASCGICCRSHQGAALRFRTAGPTLHWRRARRTCWRATRGRTTPLSPAWPRTRLAWLPACQRSLCAPALSLSVAQVNGKVELYCSFGVMGGFMQPQVHAPVSRELARVHIP